MKTNLLNKKSPITSAIGLFILIFLTQACDQQKTPAQVSLIFWQAMMEKNINLARKYCKTLPQTIFDTQTIAFTPNTTLTLGKIIINGNQATVEMRVSPPIDKKPYFTSFLVQQENHWQVDYQRSIGNFNDNPVNTFFKSLESLGNDLNKQLEDQLPILEKEINSLGEELKKKIDEFGNELKHALPKEPNKPHQNSI